MSEEEGIIRLDSNRVRGITHLGGTILGTTNKGNPFEWPVKEGDKVVAKDRSDELLEKFNKLGFDALIAIGGDGSLGIANRLAKKGLPVVGVPKQLIMTLLQQWLPSGLILLLPMPQTRSIRFIPRLNRTSGSWSLR